MAGRCYQHDTALAEYHLTFILEVPKIKGPSAMKNTRAQKSLNYVSYSRGHESTWREIIRETP